MKKLAILSIAVVPNGCTRYNTLQQAEGIQRHADEHVIGAGVFCRPQK